MTEKLNDTGGHKIVNGAEKYWKVILIVFCAGALQAQVYFNSKELDTRRDKVDEIAVIKSDLSTVKKMFPITVNVLMNCMKLSIDNSVPVTKRHRNETYTHS
jgi:hypothetical protein